MEHRTWNIEHGTSNPDKRNRDFADSASNIGHSKEDAFDEASFDEPNLNASEIAELRGKLAAWDENWSAPGMETHDRRNCGGR